jgi:hypothetical protein
MIVLQLEQEVAASPYFVIHHQEPSPSGASTWVISGILGDGWYEGEVAVEVGARQGVTFADEWFDRLALNDFFNRVDRDRICAALYQALAFTDTERSCNWAAGTKQTAPHYVPGARQGSIGSGEPCWIAVA